MGDRNGDKHTQKMNKKQMWKLQRNYFIAHNLQTIYKYNKKLNGHLEEEMVEKECGFTKGRSCTDAIFTVQQIIEKRKENNLQLFFIYRLWKGIR